MKFLSSLLCATVLMTGLLEPVFAQTLTEDQEEITSPTSAESPVEEVANSTEATINTVSETATSTDDGTTNENESATSTEPALETISTPDTGSIIVKFNESRVDLDTSKGTATAEDFADSQDLTLTDTLSDANVAVYATSEDTVASIANQLEDNPLVEYAEPNYRRSPATLASTTNDTFAGLMWGLDNTGQTVNGTVGIAGDDIDIARAWSLSTGTSTIVAVIDTGVVYTHPDLAANMWDGTNCVSDTGSPFLNASNSPIACIHGYDFASNDPDPRPEAPYSGAIDGRHGTHVAGTIAAAMNNATGTIGVAPKAKIMAIRFGFDVATEVRAIDFARQNGAKVINASYGGSGFSQAEYDAIQRFTNAGGIFVAAAGNASANTDTPGNLEYPAGTVLPGVISVAATDQNDALASFSNYGSTTVDIGAPGVNILSTYTPDGTSTSYALANGTSMAAPHVAGVVALIQSLYPSASSTAIVNAILSGGDYDPALDGKTVSGKRLNAYTALLYASTTDMTSPAITLNGASTTDLAFGVTYAELGASAFDDRDGTTTIAVSGSVNTSAAGTYTITYDATDRSGNQTQTVRTVTVAAAPVSSGGGGGGGGGSSSSHSSSSKSSKKSSTKTTTKPTTTVVTPTKPVSGANPVRLPSATSSPVVAPTVPLFFFTRVLIVGSTGADVTALQQTLTRLGVYSGPVTGYFGPMTQTAVRAYQAKHSIVQVGFTGPMTRALLNQGI